MSRPVLSAHPPSLSVQVAPAQVTELAQLAEVLAQSFHPPHGLQAFLYPLYKFGIRQDIRQRLEENNGRYCCLAAWVESHLVGTLEISVRRLMTGQHSYISNLAVLPGWRRRGIALELLMAAERTVRLWGYQTLYLHVLEENQPARQLYHRHHYRLSAVQSGQKCGIPWPFGSRQLLLYKSLS